MWKQVFKTFKDNKKGYCPEKHYFSEHRPALFSFLCYCPEKLKITSPRVLSFLQFTIWKTKWPNGSEYQEFNSNLRKFNEDIHPKQIIDFM